MLERAWLMNKLRTKLILYERIELIKPERHEELLQDLKERTGINIKKFDIHNINFLRDTADILIYYEDEGNHIDHFRNPQSGLPSGG